MKKKAVSGIMLTLLLVGMLTLAFDIQPVKADWTWTETIYIRVDGSIEPDTAPISSADNITYTLTDNIVGEVPEWSSAIVVERDNIVIDGAGFILQGIMYACIKAVESTGIDLSLRSNVTIRNIEIQAFWHGILLNMSLSNIIHENNISNNCPGIYLRYSSNNTIVRNKISNNCYGIRLSYSSSNTISRNNITANSYGGILLSICSNNIIYHNNFVDNIHQTLITAGNVNIWDNGYPSGGNYWSDYTGVDGNGDGIGDEPYIINTNNQDRYPLMEIIPEFPSFLVLPLFMIATLLAVIVYRRKHPM